MLVPGDLGFHRVAVVFLFLVFSVFALIIRRKWRLAVARREEINRLLVLAAEEAARAELEASIGYGYGYGYSVAPPPVSVPVTVTVSPSVPSQHVCPVCYAFAPHRCAQCKSVYYCSGKCQITHWRLGHKDECHPLPANSEINDEVFVGNALKPPYSDNYAAHVVNGGLPCDKLGEGGLKETRSSNISLPSPDVFNKDGSAGVGRSLHEQELVSLSDRHESSKSSGVRASFSGQGASVNDSDSDDDDSVHNFNSGSCDSSSTFDSFETASSDKNVEQTKPLEEKVLRTVVSDGSYSASNGLKDEALPEMANSSSLNVSCSDKNATEPSISTSGFWDGTLDTSRTRRYVPSSSALPKSAAAANRKLSDLTSTLQYPSNMLGSLSSDSHTKVSEPSGDNCGFLATTKIVVESTSPIKKSKAATIRQTSSSLSSLGPDTRIRGVNSQLKSGEIGAESDNSKERGSLMCCSERANDPGRSNKDTRKSLPSLKLGVPQIHSNGPLSSGLNGQDALAPKSGEAGDNAVTPPQVVRSTPSASVGLKSSVQKVVDQFRASKITKQGDIVGKNSEKAVFSYEAFVKLYHWNKVELRPSGLINCGNSCYANAVLQCLAFTPPLTAYLLQGLHSKACSRKDWCFTCEFERLILKANEVGYPQSPIGILSHIQKIGSHLTNGREEDAHEFLRYAIETMQFICLREAGVKASSSLEEETTLMGLTFGGYLRSKIKCTRCHGTSERQERMMDLTVEIEGDIETLEDALRQFTRTESLDGENKYHCGRCKSYEKAKKKLSILEAPNVLTIALKRFQSGKFGKLNKSIQFPEILNLAPYMRGGSDKSPIYRLYGVIVHLDIMNASFSGHYVCYVRNAQNKWYKIDDSTVKPVELERVLNMGAYMLFYARCSPRAPRSIRSGIVSRDLLSKIKAPEVDPSRSNGRSSSSRQRVQAANVNHVPDGLANLGYVHPDLSRSRPVHNIFDPDSSSDSSSILSHSDAASTSTDSTRDSMSTDDLTEYIFGHNAFFRHSSDSDTSSSSSSSSSPQYLKLSPLSNSERYASCLSEKGVVLTDTGKELDETCRSKESGSVGGVTFLHSDSSSMQVRNLVNSSSCREADSKRLGRANPSSNPFDYGNSGVHLRRSSRKKPD